MLALVLVCACTKSPPLYKVKGKASYRGKALTTGTVAFHHTDARSPMVTGDIHADGTFELTTKRPGDGAVPGEYRVTVTSMLPGKGVEGVDQDYRPPQPLIPLRFMRLDETPLKATIEPKDSNEIHLSLSP